MSNSLSSMVERLKFWSQVQTSEGFADPGDFERIVQEASQRHNPNYLCTGSSFSIPANEVPLVNQLALSLLYNVRCARMAQAPTMRTGDFQITRDTPFEKNLKLANAALAEYQKQCQVLGISNYYGSSAVVVTEFTAENLELGAMTPLEIAAEPPFVNLAVPAAPIAGSTFLLFSTQIFGQFATRWVFHTTGTEPLHQPWNNSSATKIPQINDLAATLLKTTNQRISSVKVVEMDMTPGTVHRFLVVTQNRSGIYGYSNEVTVTVV